MEVTMRASRKYQKGGQEVLQKMKSIERRVGCNEKKEGDVDRNVRGTEKSWDERKCGWQAPKNSERSKKERENENQTGNKYGGHTDDSLPTYI